MVNTDVSEPPAQDEQLSPLQAGHPDFAELYGEHSQAIYYLALRMLGDPERAQDATHDVFLRAFKNYERFRGDASPRTWLYRIAINHCKNLQQSWSQRHLVTNVDDVIWESTAGVGDSPLRALESKELGERIQETLDAMPEEYRLLLLLVADQELSYQQIAALTEQSADAVRGKLHRARKAFSMHFQQASAGRGNRNSRGTSYPTQ
jgi:RNA polymerase sigma-70 factor (ECF subfamily)